ncbi:MAG TPA: universal stress protein [Miltoncostaeaceae bacterium]|nr:universal stress protein [Miltoncostaeaceae bacterium]
MAPELTRPDRGLRARSLALIAYGEVGSSLVFALGIVALYAVGLTPWVLLVVGLLVLVVSLSYAEGAAAMPEPGGAATFVRRAFSDPAGFVTGWLLFLDYFVVIALAALFVPHYLGAALEWESARDRPWDAIIGVLVILAIAAARRRVKLYKVAVAMVAVALVVQLAIAVIGFAVVVSADALTMGTDLGEAPSWSSIALALALATLAYTGIESVSSYAAEAREPGRTLPRSLFVGIGIAVAMNVAVAVVGVSAFPAGPDPGAPDGVANGLGTEWLKAPLVGIASALDAEVGAGDALEIVVGVTGTLILLAAIITAMVGAERLAQSMARYDMLPHAFARPARGARTPLAGAVAVAAIASGLLVLAVTAGNGERFLAGLYSFGVLIALTAAQLAVVRLRMREPELERPFRVPLGVRVRGLEVPLPAVVGAFLTLALFAAAVATSEGARIAGPVWLAGGVAVYLWSRRAGGETVLGRATPPEPDLVPSPEADIQRILVPVKPGEIRREVLATALRLAKQSGGTVRVIHVLKIPMAEPLDADLGDADQGALEVVEEARDTGRDEGVRVEGLVIRARSRSEAIVDEARKVGADLIMMGSSPRWRSQSRFFSPLVDEVLRSASCEVMVVTYPEGVLEEAGGA